MRGTIRIWSDNKWVVTDVNRGLVKISQGVSEEALSIVEIRHLLDKIPIAVLIKHTARYLKVPKLF